MRSHLQTLTRTVSVVRTLTGGFRPSPKAITRTMSSNSTGLMFQLKLNPITGNSEWIVIEEELDDASPKPMLATTSYLDMLNDSPRNRVYRTAIDKTVSKQCHVLDIGAGTGLLSMMAARAMGVDDDSSPSKGVVTACESYLPMVKLMKKVLRANDMNSKIRVLNKRSDEVEVGVDVASRADVLVSEILDSELLGEGLIPSLQHAHDKLLVENYKTVPYRATTYGQLVESTYLWELHDLYSNEANVADGIHLVPKGKESILRVKPQQFAMHCDAMGEELRLLSEPFKIFEFDFWKRPDSHGETQVHTKATNNGTVHAVISWWVLQLDEEGNIFYSTSPKWINSPSTNNGLSSMYTGTRDWCDHWKQCVWFTKGKGLPVRKDEDVRMDATHTDISISYKFNAQSQTSEVDHSQDSHLTLSPERIAIYGDNNWRQFMLKAINYALKGKESPLCVIADDSVFLSVAVAHISKSSHIIAMFPGLGDKGRQYLQAVADENGYSMDRIQVINTRKQQLTMNDTHQNKVDLLIAEPFYFGAEGMLPWQGLQFWSKRTMIDSMLAEDVCIMPCKGILKACAMSLPDLWRSRCALENIEGFDHTMVNTTLGACGPSSESPCLPFFIWQCGETQKLSDTYTIMEFDFLKPLSSCHGKAKVEFIEAGVCHGFALWIDWVMDSTNDIVMSTGLGYQRYWKQGVKLLAEPLKIGPGICSTVIEAHFDSSSGELSVNNR
ncbi:putative methyltransferase [Helianthus annuus]|uniref:Protein arginine N-methyltransferase n=1 Tax=Helianthus annuus TaxID=4232 RepID=A0A9K3DJH2_HELAN|nr:putative methyltransferase [Helianthus annuus]KAJ0429007.1 putative methyltransferase [Helianthus annuus]KAJ0447363.1 putative methyltransferase [Helianthus annuus]KAJ0632240.1 putative methyltransferase [Helianthus annuus]KAJ0812993.1 putative methyltransferase [Helianthus annuus]